MRLRACEDAGEAVELANAFQKVSRVVRLTLALDFKLEHDAAREAQAQAREAGRTRAETAEVEARAPAEATRNAPKPPYDPGPIEIRQDRVLSLMKRLLWNECEGDEEEYEILREDLTARLDEAARSPDFETIPIETLARRVIADMDLSGELTLSVCEATGEDAGLATPELRSSA